MNNEPVAYGMLTFCKNCGEQNPYALKTLTDEEIRKVADEVFKDYKNWHHYQIDFARAILKKASKK
jgi:spore coat protein CotF